MFAHREFRRLWTATTIDAFGSWLLVMALPLHVFASTGSVASTGLTLAVEAAPALLVGLWAGTLVDRWPRRRVLVLGNLVAAAGVALLATSPVGGSVGGSIGGPDGGSVGGLVGGPVGGLVGLAVGGVPVTILGGLLVESVAVCFLQPALAATLPSVVGTGPELVSANAWTSASSSVLRMLGPPAGTLLVVHGDFRVVVLVDAVSYLVAAALLARLRFEAPTRPAGLELSSLAAGLRSGLAEVARTKMVSGLIVTTWVFWAANAALTIVLVSLAGASVGWVIAGLGLGYLLGSAVAKAVILRYATRTVLTASYLTVGVCFVVAFAVPALWVIALAGVPGAVIVVAVRHRLQAGTPEVLLGRVFAVFGAADASAGVVGALAAPLLGPVALSAVVVGVAALALVLLPGSQ